MNRQESIEFACVTTALAYHSIGDYSEPSDGFCHRCASGMFQDAGNAARYVRDAVVAKLKADGYEISSQFDSKTGDELPKKGCEQ